MSRGRVYLVGAGPGDPELLTLKGLRLIQSADVIAYDRLIDTRLLAQARPDADLIDVGKAPGSRSQKDINSILVGYAQEGKKVVRLKGGDPFVLGRGGEEAEALNDAGVKFEIVPGVTSAIAAPGLRRNPSDASRPRLLVHRRHGQCRPRRKIRRHRLVYPGRRSGHPGISYGLAQPGRHRLTVDRRRKAGRHPGRRGELGNAALAADGRGTAQLDCKIRQVGRPPGPRDSHNRERGRAAREAELVRDAAAIRQTCPRHPHQKPGQHPVRPTLGIGSLPTGGPRPLR